MKRSCELIGVTLPAFCWKGPGTMKTLS